MNRQITSTGLGFQNEALIGCGCALLLMVIGAAAGALTLWGAMAVIKFMWAHS